MLYFIYTVGLFTPASLQTGNVMCCTMTLQWYDIARWQEFLICIIILCPFMNVICGCHYYAVHDCILDIYKIQKVCNATHKFLKSCGKFFFIKILLSFINAFVLKFVIFYYYIDGYNINKTKKFETYSANTSFIWCSIP